MQLVSGRAACQTSCLGLQPGPLGTVLFWLPIPRRWTDRLPWGTHQLPINCWSDVSHISTNGCHSDSPQHPSPHEPKQLLVTSRKQTTAFHIPFFWLLQSHPHRESQMRRRGHYQVREGLTALCQPPARQQGSFVQHMLGGFFTVIQSEGIPLTARLC